MSLLSDHMIASAILALALLATACAGGDDVQPAAGSKQVTFKVRLDGIDSRALSDGSQATRLEAVAYDASGKAVQVRSGLMTDLQGSVTFNLVEGVTYRFAFWAQSPSATCYTLSNDYTAVAVDYSGTANDDSRDAFFQHIDSYTVGTSTAMQAVTLVRPLAQVDFVVAPDEWERVVRSTSPVTATGFTLPAGLYTRLNLLTGEVSDPTAQPVSLASAPVPTASTLQPDGSYRHTPMLVLDGSQYVWLSMGYVLAPPAPSASMLSQVALAMTSGTAKAITTIAVPSVPYKRNRRTVIVLSQLASKLQAGAPQVNETSSIISGD